MDTNEESNVFAQLAGILFGVGIGVGVVCMLCAFYIGKPDTEEKVKKKFVFPYLDATGTFMSSWCSGLSGIFAFIVGCLSLLGMFINWLFKKTPVPV